MSTKALAKGETLPLCQDSGERLHKICIGLNWGGIPRKNYIGIGPRYKAVDLDSSAALFNEQQELLELVFYNNKRSADEALVHGGDDLVGDRSQDDKLDNEVLLINLDKVRPEVTQIFIMLNSYTRQNFGEIPYVKVRIYEGTPVQVDETIAYFNLAKDSSYATRVAVVMAKLYRESAEADWKFETIGDSVAANDILEAVNVIRKRFLKTKAR